ncbi:sulfurtransferase [Photobacterium nomapromontoriensis]|uniref:sulfurtransferase n=1 Tax=Photobacterium nomapromontoriensis TaxID=2910237 RepID=UPI003D103001
MSALNLPSSLVSVSWLAEHFDAPQLIVLDASWFMPGTECNAFTEWQHKRIPGARFFDFDQKIAAPNSPFPHMLPSTALFEIEVGKLGISNNHVIVIYDTQGIFSAPRVWWMFRAMGHKAVAVLDGGLPAWEAAAFEVVQDEPEDVEPTPYVAQLDAGWVIDAETLHQRLNAEDVQVFDARPAARFYGTQPEPRDGIRSGHMPNAKSLPFSQLLDNGHYLPVSQLQKRFDALSYPDQQHIFSCGSGVTACILALAAELAGRQKLTVYDGSWTEWGSTIKYPVV